MIDIDVSKIISEIGEPKARLIENEDEKQQKMYMLVFSFAFLIIFIVGMFAFFFLSRSEKAKASVISKEIETVKKDNADLESINIQAQSIQTRNKDLLNIIQGNPNWSYVLGVLEEVVPKSITFTRLELGSPSSMSITGVSPDYETLSKLIVSMSGFMVEKENVFGNVSVDNASLSKSQDGKVKIDFAVSFNFLKKINKESINPVAGEAAVPTPTPTPTPTPVTPTPTPAETPTPTPTPSEGGGLPVL